MLEILRSGKSGMRNSKYAKMVDSLQWRQNHLNSEVYTISLQDGTDLSVYQVANGEISGIGTGSSTLWLKKLIIISDCRSDGMASCACFVQIS